MEYNQTAGVEEATVPVESRERHVVLFLVLNATIKIFDVIDPVVKAWLSSSHLRCRVSLPL